MNHSARKHDGGIEYHTAYGSLNGFDPLKDQEQQFFPSIDVDLGPQWGFNLGVGGRNRIDRSPDHQVHSRTVLLLDTRPRRQAQAMVEGIGD
jgi:hypothetical protein